MKFPDRSVIGSVIIEGAGDFDVVMERRAALAAPPAIDPERLARAWWTAVNEPEDGPWLDASDDQRKDARAWAAAIIAAYEAEP